MRFCQFLGNMLPLKSKRWDSSCGRICQCFTVIFTVLFPKSYLRFYFSASLKVVWEVLCTTSRSGPQILSLAPRLLPAPLFLLPGLPMIMAVWKPYLGDLVPEWPGWRRTSLRPGTLRWTVLWVRSKTCFVWALTIIITLRNIFKSSLLFSFVRINASGLLLRLLAPLLRALKKKMSPSWIPGEKFCRWKNVHWPGSLALSGSGNPSFCHRPACSGTGLKLHPGWSLPFLLPYWHTFWSCDLWPQSPLLSWLQQRRKR